MIDVCVRKNIIRDVGADVGRVVRPLHRRRQALDVADQPALKHAVRVDVALDRVVVAAPRPVRTEGHRGPHGAVVVGALRAAARRRVDPPQVVEDLVAVGLEVRVLRAEGRDGGGAGGEVARRRGRQHGCARAEGGEEDRG